MTVALNVAVRFTHSGAVFELATAAALVGIVLAITGIYRIAEAFEYPMWLRVLLAVAVLVPLVSLVVLVLMYVRASRR